MSSQIDIGFSRSLGLAHSGAQSWAGTVSPVDRVSPGHLQVMSMPDAIGRKQSTTPGHVTRRNPTSSIDRAFDTANASRTRRVADSDPTPALRTIRLRT